MRHAGTGAGFGEVERVLHGGDEYRPGCPTVHDGPRWNRSRPRPILKAAADDDPDDASPRCQPVERRQQRVLRKPAGQAARHALTGFGQFPGIEIAEQIGHQRPVAAAPRTGGQSATRQRRDQDCRVALPGQRLVARACGLSPSLREFTGQHEGVAEIQRQRLRAFDQATEQTEFGTVFRLADRQRADTRR